jgi:hypothetical protein
MSPTVPCYRAAAEFAVSLKATISIGLVKQNAYLMRVVVTLLISMIASLAIRSLQWVRCHQHVPLSMAGFPTKLF